MLRSGEVDAPVLPKKAVLITPGPNEIPIELYKNGIVENANSKAEIGEVIIDAESGEEEDERNDLKVIAEYISSDLDIEYIKVLRYIVREYNIEGSGFEIDEDVVVSGAYKTHAPFYKYADAGVTVTLSTSSTGTGRTITASSPIWTTDYVNHYIKVDGSQIKTTVEEVYPVILI